MKIIFMGTPDFAVPVLEGLCNSRHEVVLVVTQPDRAKGRQGKPSPSPVKESAVKHGLEVYQPQKLRDREAVEVLKGYESDLIVVAAFGQILPSEVLRLPPHGCINVHASLLPEYRGAAPIQWAILDGKKKTGITIMQMDEGLDTGDILLQKKVSISREETGGSLFEKLSAEGKEALLNALDLMEKGELKAIPQDNSLSSYAKMLTKGMGRINFHKSAQELERMIRALNPWPSAYTRLDGQILKIWKAGVGEGGEGVPGTIMSVFSDSFTVSCGEGELKVYEVQLSGRRRMSAHDFLLGVSLEPGMRLGG